MGEFLALLKKVNMHTRLYFQPPRVATVKGFFVPNLEKEYSVSTEEQNRTLYM